MHVEVVTSDTDKLFEGFLSINRNPDGDEWFSIVVVLSDFPTDQPMELKQIRARIHPTFLAGLARTPLDDGGFRYRLSVPEGQLSHTPLPLQFRGRDGKISLP